MEYEFAFSNQGREKLRRELGPIVAQIVEDKLKEEGLGKGFIKLKLTDKEIAVPHGLIERIETWIKQQAREKLEKYLKENTVTGISVHIEGNRGVMKCLNPAGKVLAS